MVYGCKGDLHSNLVIEILEHYTIKILVIVDCDVPMNAIAIDDILPEEFFDGCGSYVCETFASTHFVKYSTATIAKV
jgi:hypothetical protein